jgi:hypothetical protein
VQRYTRFLSGATARPVIEEAALEEGRRSEFVGRPQPAGIAWALTLSTFPAGVLGVTK